MADGQCLTVSSHGRVERGRTLSCDCFESTNPICEGPPSCLHPVLIISQKTCLQIPSHWGLGVHHMEFGKNKQPAHNSKRDFPMTYWRVSERTGRRADFRPRSGELSCERAELRISMKWVRTQIQVDGRAA